MSGWRWFLYVAGPWLMLALWVGLVLWAVVSPETKR